MAKSLYPTSVTFKTVTYSSPGGPLGIRIQGSANLLPDWTGNAAVPEDVICTHVEYTVTARIRAIAAANIAPGDSGAFSAAFGGAGGTSVHTQSLGTAYVVSVTPQQGEPNQYGEVEVVWRGWAAAPGA